MYPLDSVLILGFGKMKVRLGNRRSLEEATVSANDFVHCVASHFIECLGSIYGRGVRLVEIADNQRRRAVNGAKLDLGIGTTHDVELMAVFSMRMDTTKRLGGFKGTHENFHQVKPRSGINTRVDDGIVSGVQPWSYYVCPARSIFAKAVLMNQ